MTEVKNILFVGVGGQGTILASKIFTEGLMKDGFDVKMSEVHGMAQRGGSVTTHVRFGHKVHSPLIEKGTADVIIAFEKSEAVRWISYLKKHGHLIVNDYEIHPVPILIGEEIYPQGINEKLKSEVPNTIIINADKIAEELGNLKAQNLVLLGALIKVLKLHEMDWISVIREVVPSKAFEINKNALTKGLEL